VFDLGDHGATLIWVADQSAIGHLVKVAARLERGAEDDRERGHEQHPRARGRGTSDGDGIRSS
jgi:hypothetical protein